MVSLISDQGHYTFLYRYAKHNRGKKNKRTNTDSGQLQVQEGGSLCGNFVELSVHLQAIAGVYFVLNFHKATRNADSYLFPADGVLLWTAILSRLFSSVLFCQKYLFVFSGTFLPSPTSSLVVYLTLRRLVWFSCQSRQRYSLTDAHTQHNEWATQCHSITTC